MSISWDVLEGGPSSPQAVIARALAHLELFTGHEGWRIEATGKVDGQLWTWSGVDPGSSPTPVIDWVVEVTAELDGHAGHVRMSSSQELEDDGSPVEGHASFEALSHRTQTSAVLGLAAGLAAYVLSGGEVSGPGFDRWQKPEEVDEVIERFVRAGAGHARSEDAILALGEQVGVPNLEL
jgi:hypothetical protein